MSAKWADGQKLISSYGTSGRFESQRCGQAVWEACGWRAVETPAETPAAPVERALAPGWSDVRGCGCSPCKQAGRAWKYISVASGPAGDYHCAPCAEAKGAFAAPAPTVTTGPRLAARFLDDLDKYPRLLEEMRAKSHPAPKPAPRCEYKDGDCGSVERLAVRVVGKYKPMLICEQCYLGHERYVADRRNVLDGTWAGDGRPRATIGTVPQAFGLSVGILSRGMAR